MTVQNIHGGQIGQDRTIGELVLERPTRARLFERLHIDYCCGGQRTLAEACDRSGLQIEPILAALQTLDEVDLGAGAGQPTDWRTVGTEVLCEHIVSVHHDFLRRNLPRIDSLLGTVIRVHGTQAPWLGDLPRVFGAIRSALEPHLASEETELFPAILAAEHGGNRVAEEIIAGHEYEHEQLGAALVEMRSLCHDFDRRRARCNTHRALLDALEELELDIHQHVHEENNVLFVRARAHGRGPTGRPHSASRLHSSGQPPARSKQPLPACCQGWVAQQGQRWTQTRRAAPQAGATLAV